MTKKKSEMTPEQVARTAATALALRERTRDRINELQRANRAQKRAALPAKSAEELQAERDARKAADAERKRLWALKNADRVRERRKQQYEANRAEAIRAATEWNRSNKERRAEISRRYAAANRDGRRAVKANRRARERHGSLDKAATKALVTFLLAAQKRRCAACGLALGEKYELDHIVALAAGGTNDRTNFQMLCRPCNRAKATKHPVDFMQSLGKLL